MLTDHSPPCHEIRVPSASRLFQWPWAHSGEAAMAQLADGYDQVVEPADQPRIKLVRAA